MSELYVGARVRLKGTNTFATVVCPNRIVYRSDLGNLRDPVIPPGLMEWMTWYVKRDDWNHQTSYADFNLELIKTPIPWEPHIRKLSTETPTTNIDFCLTRRKRAL